MKKNEQKEKWVKIFDSAEDGFTTYRMHVAYGWLYLVRAGTSSAMTFVKDTDSGSL